MVTIINPPKPGTNGNGANGNGHRTQRTGGGGTGSGDGRHGGGGGGRGDDRSPPPEREPVVSRYRIGLVLTLAGIAVTFATLTIVYVPLSLSDNWRPIEMPPLLWLSTALILFSSLTFESARVAFRRGAIAAAHSRLRLTLLLGGGFILSQAICWQRLAAQGVYVATNPHSAFFYLLTGLHVLHIVGGIGALSYLLLRARRERERVAAERDALSAEIISLDEGGVRKPVFLARAALDAGALYWHFVGGLWVYLFMLLFLWR